MDPSCFKAQAWSALVPASTLQVHHMRQLTFLELIDGAHRAPDKEKLGSYWLNVGEPRMETRRAIEQELHPQGGELEPINGVFIWPNCEQLGWSLALTLHIL